MALKNLDTVLAEATVDLKKLHRIYVNPTGAVPFYNKHPETAFEVDATNKGIRVVHLSEDRKSYVAGDYVVVLGADGQTVQVVANAAKDVFDAMSQPHLVKVPAGADAGRAVLTGFRHYLAGTFDGLFAGAPVKVEVDEDTTVPPVLMASFNLDKTEITGKVGDVIKVSVQDVAPGTASNKGINVDTLDKTTATAVDNLDGTYSVTLAKVGTTTAHWVAVDGGGANKELAVTVSLAL